MGYYMSQMSSKFLIEKKNFRKCLEAIKALDPEKDGGKGFHCTAGGPKIRHFAWVETEEYKEAKTLQEAINAWNWQPELDKEGNIVDIYFEGEKLGDEQILFNAIAPFVEKDSYIQMSGEDDSFWRWCFDGKICFENNPTITW